jgi:hypothetical protein
MREGDSNITTNAACNNGLEFRMRLGTLKNTLRHDALPTHPPFESASFWMIALIKMLEHRRALLVVELWRIAPAVRSEATPLPKMQ